jgi:flavin reductase (DIM6/NTAB) family NADH-FMN oxidoreductase RutF
MSLVMKKSIIIGEVPNKEIHQILISAVAPRPIAFVSTLDENGNKNLAPYSFFNVFSSNPPIAVFSSNRKGTDNTTKDTLHNVKVSGECVINVVPFSIVRQMSLTSVEFPNDVSEFEKAGLTPEPSATIKAPRVAESPVNLECKVKDIITLGDKGGAGHLIICEILHISIDESVITDGALDQQKLDLMGRLGKNYYVRASGDALMEIKQVVSKIPLGFDGLPAEITKSKVLTGNDISFLASLFELPDYEKINEYRKRHLEFHRISIEEKHLLAQELIRNHQAEEALLLLLA